MHAITGSVPPASLCPSNSVSNWAAGAPCSKAQYPAGKPVTVRADLEPGLGQPEPSGRVTFFEDGAKIATARLAPDGSGGEFASATFTARSGTHPIVAVYQGDGTYTAATSNTIPLAGS